MLCLNNGIQRHVPTYQCAELKTIHSNNWKSNLQLSCQLDDVSLRHGGLDDICGYISEFSKRKQTSHHVN